MKNPTLYFQTEKSPGAEEEEDELWLKGFGSGSRRGAPTRDVRGSIQKRSGGEREGVRTVGAGKKDGKKETRN